MTSHLTLDPVDWTASADDPYPLYKLLRDHAPAFWDERNDTYVLTRYADVYEVLGDPQRFSSLPIGLVNGALTPTSQIRQADGARHTLTRRTILPMFTPGEMRRLVPYFRRLVGKLIDGVAGQDVVNITEAFAIPLPGRVTLDIIGLPLEVHARFKELTDDRLRIIMTRTNKGEPPEIRSRLQEIRASLWEIVAPLAEDRRRDPQHDVLTLVVQAQDRHGREEFSDELALDVLAEALTAGFETTQHLIELLLDKLADEPELWQRLRADRRLDRSRDGGNAALEEPYSGARPAPGRRRHLPRRANPQGRLGHRRLRLGQPGRATVRRSRQLSPRSGPASSRRIQLRDPLLRRRAADQV